MNVPKGLKGFQPKALYTRFWTHVRIPDSDGCWLWTGATRGPAGRDYGMIWHNGRNRPAAQVSVELHTGQPWPSGMDACHRCDNPRCVRPDHIFAGTPSDNWHDSKAKGRMRNHYDGRAVCSKGHALTPDNLNKRKRYKECRQCRNEQQRAYRAARAALEGGGR